MTTSAILSPAQVYSSISSIIPAPAVAETSVLPEHLLSAPSPLGQEHVSSMWQKHSWSIVILSFIVQPSVMWPGIFDLMSEGALGYWDISPGHPALFLPKESDPATGKSENFQLSPSPVKQSVLHVPNVRCPLPTRFLLFSSLGSNPALISTNSHERYCDKLSSCQHKVFFLFHSIFYSQHPTWAPDLQGAKQLITLFSTEIKAAQRHAVFCRTRLHLWDLLHPSLKSRHLWEQRRADF